MQKLLSSVRQAFPSSSHALPYPLLQEKLHHLRETVDKFSPHSLGINVPTDRQPIISSWHKNILFSGPKITFVPLHESDQFTIAMFLFPPHAKMPLHNHPGMNVLSRVLYGKLQVRSFDFIKVPGKQNFTKDEARLAKLVENDKIISSETPTHITYPADGGNIHSFTSLTTSALFDILAPPYNNMDRTCTYFHESDIEHDDIEELKNMAIELDESEKRVWLIPSSADGFVCESVTEEEIKSIFVNGIGPQ